MKKRVLLFSLFQLFSLHSFAGIDDWLSLPKDILDNQKLNSYTPPQQAIEVADTLQLTDYGRKLLYLNQPTFSSDRTLIYTKCNAQSQPGSTFFGCYLTGDNGIYILEIPDPRFKSSMYVTTAHEILHAGYHRLKAEEKASIDRLLLEVLNGSYGPELEEKLETYRTYNPKAVAGELHSFVGSEIETLPKALETYYTRYFKSRKAVIELHKKSTALFGEKRKEIHAFDHKLATLNAKLKREKEQLEELESELKSMQSQMELYKKNGEISKHNAMVSPMNRKIAEYKKLANESMSTYNEYNDTAQKRNKVVHEFRALAAIRDATS